MQIEILYGAQALTPIPSTTYLWFHFQHKFIKSLQMLRIFASLWPFQRKKEDLKSIILQHEGLFSLVRNQV